MNGIIDVLASPTPGVIEIWDYKAMVKPPSGDPKLTSLENQMYNYVEIVEALFPKHSIVTAVLYFINELGPKGSGNPVHKIDLTSSTVSTCITAARDDANSIVEEFEMPNLLENSPTRSKEHVDVRNMRCL